MKVLFLGLAVAALIGSPAQSQNVVYWPAPISAAQATQMSYFPMGTEVNLRTRTQVSTKVNEPGYRFYLEVAESLSYRGQVVIPAGSVAVAEVANAQKNGHFGKKGKLEIRLLHVETPYGPIRLNGQSYDEGTSGTITSVATMLLVTPLGFLVHGTSAQLRAGTTVKAYLGEDLRFTVQPQSQITLAQVQPDSVRSQNR